MDKKLFASILIFSFLVAVGGCNTLSGAPAPGGAYWTSTGKLVDKRFAANVNDIFTAATETLKEDNLPIVTQTLGGTYGKIESQYPDGKRIGIDIKKLSDQYTELIIRVGWTGSDDRAIALMDKIRSKVSRT